MLKLSGYSLRQAAWGGNDSPGRFLVRTYFLAGTYPVNLSPEIIGNLFR
ncbi:hypothetical protein IMPR6_200060 [Imperialibacter sp. EC-SDR9]|nr:hypothetical protein IMPERIA75_180063 [Imperialibacter sp. 75]CAD5298314.1 hypothetical protein IMPERIA89_730061 [Imperialibacter sp. 89]VVT13629.1 hypothetical protein IMPR6_200060 [Imperialibacter sp. EC-SDR9]